MVISDAGTVEKSLVRCFSHALVMLELSSAYGIGRGAHVFRLFVLVFTSVLQYLMHIHALPSFHAISSPSTPISNLVYSASESALASVPPVQQLLLCTPSPAIGIHCSHCGPLFSISLTSHHDRLRIFHRVLSESRLNSITACYGIS